MKKAHKPMKPRTQGATHDVTKTNTQRPAETALHPATPPEIMVSRAIDQELEWYFSYAESALHRERVGMLPSYAAVLVTEPTDAAIRRRAREIACIVQSCLRTLRPRHAEVLRAAYTPRAWPKSVEKAFESVAAIAVRLAFADDPWPERPSRTGLEQAAAAQLAAGIKSGSIPVGRLRNQAQRLLGGAIVAYAGLRALEPRAMGCR
jgi:hypothetical protein